MELNSNQKEAVLHDKGPILIIAGAGTGKTRVITSRILELINSGKASATEILALTFTDKAANEMVERVDLEMPLGYEELNIKTFHSFSEHIIRESGLEIGIDPGYKVLDQVDQWFFFKKHLFEFELDYYRPLGNPNRFIYSLLNHFSKLKDELIDADDYIKFSEKLSGEDFDKMQEIAKTYKVYQDLLIENNYLDFADLCYYANHLLDKRASVLKKYQEQFKYILVDEFQDTNYAQFQLVLKLSREHGNLCVVGDDDQSIYKWRGASLSNILQFEKHFPGTKKIVLSDNYRSSQSILDCSYTLIQGNNPDRLELKLGLNKKLKCHSEDDRPVEVNHFPDFMQESSFVAEKIKDLHDSNGVEFENFAILVRANQQTHPFIDELKRLGIPFQVKNPKGLFALDEIKDLIAVVRMVANPNDDISLLRILKMDVFDIQMSEILKHLNKYKSHLFNVPENPENSLPGLEDGISKIHSILVDLIEFSKNHSVGLVINEFLNQSGYLHYLTSGEHFEVLDNINEFARQVSKFEKENENSSVLDFVNYLDLLEEANAVFAVDSFADRNSVQILTSHGAKGLEFDYVFVANAVNHRFPSTRRSDPFDVPEDLTNEIYPEGDFHVQEERRLFYVAMTRARKQLFITYSDQYEGKKKWNVSPFVQEVLECSSAKIVEHEVAEDAVKRLQVFKEPNKPIFELPSFSKKRLSYSQFDTFKSCPLKYNYRYLMGVPVPPAHAANFGSTIHNTLNQFYKVLKSNKPVSIEVLSELYENNWIPEGYESAEHEKVRKEKGWEVLKLYYDNNCDPWIIPSFLEKPFNLKIGDYWISGRIDRIDRLADGTFEVIDYKTGRSKNSGNLSKDLQLSIYALACRDILNLSISKLSLYFLEENEKFSTSRSDEFLNSLPDEISALIKEIEASEFHATPGFHCGFCDFRLICPAV
ncbi:MAG: ATP-dependent DNA helicase [bacterium]|nr:ATP-dependent DNA helicase [bacterium]